MLSEPDSQAHSGKDRHLRLIAAFALLYAAIAAPLVLNHSMSGWLIATTLVLAAGLTLLSAIDVQSFRLPDALTFPLLFAGLAIAGLQGFDPFVWQSASAALGGLSLFAIGWLYRHLRGRDGLGLGDAKLFAASGAWVGAEGLASVLLIACVSALAAVLVWRMRNENIGGQSALPFGPFLALGTWAVWLYGPLA